MTTPAAAVAHLLPRAPRPRPIIRQTRSADVTFPDVDVRHGYGWRLDPIWVVLPDRPVEPFEITYTLSAKNLPTTVKGVIRLLPTVQHAEPWLADDDETGDEAPS